MKRIKKFNEEIKKFNLDKYFIDLRKSTNMLRLKEQISKIKSLLSILPIPNKIVGISIEKTFVGARCGIEIKANSEKIILGVGLNDFYCLNQSILDLNVEIGTEILLTNYTKEDIEKKQKAFFKLPFKKAEKIVIEALEQIKADTQKRIDFLKESVS